MKMKMYTTMCSFELLKATFQPFELHLTPQLFPHQSPQGLSQAPTFDHLLKASDSSSHSHTTLPLYRRI